MSLETCVVCGKDSQKYGESWKWADKLRVRYIATSVNKREYYAICRYCDNIAYHHAERDAGKDKDPMRMKSTELDRSTAGRPGGDPMRFATTGRNQRRHHNRDRDEDGLHNRHRDEDELDESTVEKWHVCEEFNASMLALKRLSDASMLALKKLSETQRVKELSICQDDPMELT